MLVNWEKTCGFSGSPAHTRMLADRDETRFEALCGRDDAAYWAEYTLYAPAEDA